VPQLDRRNSRRLMPRRGAVSSVRRRKRRSVSRATSPGANGSYSPFAMGPSSMGSGTSSSRSLGTIDAMFALIVAVIIVMVMAEIYAFALVAGAIGALNAIGLLILLSLCGVWLTKREGIGLLTRTRRQLDAGQMPTNELIDGVLLLVAGLLLII